MKRRFNTARRSNYDVWASISQVPDKSVGQRIREAIIGHVGLETFYPALFDELKDSPTHNMECDPLRDYTRDDFDRAMTILDNLGSKADLDRLSKSMQSKSNEEKAADSKVESTE